MEKSEVIQKKVVCTPRRSENIRFYIFTSENIKYTLYINNIFLYFTTLYIIKLAIMLYSPDWKALLVLVGTAQSPSQCTIDSILLALPCHVLSSGLSVTKNGAISDSWNTLGCNG